MLTTVREQQRRDSWTAVQAAASALGSERGFDAVAVDDVAAAAGVFRRTISRLFPSTAAALLDPHPDDAEVLEALLPAVDTSDGVWPALRAVCLDVVARQDRVLVVRCRLVGDPELDASHRTAHRHVGEAMDRWVTAQPPDDAFVPG